MQICRCKLPRRCSECLLLCWCNNSALSRIILFLFTPSVFELLMCWLYQIGKWLQNRLTKISLWRSCMFGSYWLCAVPPDAFTRCYLGKLDPLVCACLGAEIGCNGKHWAFTVSLETIIALPLAASLPHFRWRHRHPRMRKGMSEWVREWMEAAFTNSSEACQLKSADYCGSSCVFTSLCNCLLLCGLWAFFYSSKASSGWLTLALPLFCRFSNVEITNKPNWTFNHVLRWWK